MTTLNQKQRHHFGMLIDLDRCNGCGSCMVACMSENNIPFRPDETDKLTSISWIRIYRVSNRKPFPETERCYLPMPCMQCAGKETGHSPCVSVCPVTATDYDENTGIVSQIASRCFGCRYCMVACPYHARSFNWWDPVWPDGMEKMLNPDVSVRMRGVVEKCSFCFHRYQSARETSHLKRRAEIPEAEYQTACAEACPTGAIIFGDLNNRKHQITRIVQPDTRHGGKPGNPSVFRLLERLNTNPSVYYTTKKPWVRELGDNRIAAEHQQTAIRTAAGRRRRS